MPSASNPSQIPIQVVPESLSFTTLSTISWGILEVTPQCTPRSLAAFMGSLCCVRSQKKPNIYWICHRFRGKIVTPKGEQMSDYEVSEKRKVERGLRKQRILAIYVEVIEVLTKEAVKGDLPTTKVLSTLLVNQAKLEDFI